MMRQILPALLFFAFIPAVNGQYIDLLPNRSLHHWMTGEGNSVEKGWTFDADGALHLSSRGGNIVTRQEFADFELWFEFRISEKGNSGIKYRVRKYGPSLLGCEFQILDDSEFPKLPRKQVTASLYDVFQPRSQPTRTNPVGEYNIGKVEVRGNRLRHWVNGQITIDECAGSARWIDHIAQSKFHDRPGFGQNRCGRIMLTDHNSEVWYRSVYIRRL